MKSTLQGIWPFTFKAAIFDFDGTIGTSGDIWCRIDKKFLEDRGIPYDPEFGPKVAALGFKEGAQWTVDEYGFDESSDDICKIWNDMACDFYSRDVYLQEGSLEYINALKGLGIPIALASTNNENVLKSMRPRLDIWGIFDVITLGDEVPRSKNFPDIYLESAKRLHIAPQDIIVFEDIVPALKSAAQAGMTTCGVNSHDIVQDLPAVQAAGHLYLDNWTDIKL